MKNVQFKPKPEMYQWLQSKADAGYRSVPSIIQEIVAEKMAEEFNTNSGKVKSSAPEALQ